MNSNDVKRFWSHVKKGPGCWEWTANIGGNGYGQISVGGKRWTCHRLIYFHLHPKADSGLFVCHTCDNPKCVRPSHLRLWTHTENMKDMARKGRANYTFRRTPPRGDNHPTAKLTASQVRTIRDYPKSPKYMHRLARIYGVSHSAIEHVVYRTQWKYIK